MVERILRLFGETHLTSDGDQDDKKAAAVVKPPAAPVPEHHESFLEELARKECHNFPCNEHNRIASSNINEPTAANENANNTENDGQADENEDRVLKDRRHFHLLQWSSDDDSYHSYDSDDYMTDEEIGIDEDEGGAINSSDEDSFGSEDELEEEPNAQPQLNDQLMGWEDRTTMSALRPRLELSSLHTNPITSLLVGLANSENEPLIRGDIDWNYITHCPNLASYYPATELDDPFGARLMQGTLRMDPPLEATKKILDEFPKSCLDMSGFFMACQFANPKTSRIPKKGGSKKLHPLLLKSQNKRSRLNPYETEENDDAGYDSDDSDVGEVVKLVMNRTIEARKSNNIEWSMVAFLGDARTTAAHTKELLLHNPEALIDTRHGAFGVSPLDRMVSGNFIHGDTKAWAEKLRLALRAASFVRLTKEKMKQQEAQGNPPASKEISLPDGFFAPYSQFLRTVNSYLSLNDLNEETAPNNNQDFSLQSFYPYHELVRLLISPSFGGTKFGDAGFLKALDACTNSDPNAFLRPDNEGNLPIHVALSSECNTALGVKGERRLIRYLLNLDKHAALCPENNGKGRLPLRMCIDNGWPVYDLIVNAALSCDDTSGLKTPYDPDDVTYRFKDHIAQIMVDDKPLLHDALEGRYHPRFGIHGARQLVKKVLFKTSQTQQSQSCLQSRLRSFFDSHGRTALHVALEHKWPVYDIIIQENPLSLELRDPTHCGFFPFQIAACSFTDKSEAGDDDKGNATQRKCNFGGNQELVETSMLFELIRENPLCVSWNDSDGRTHIATPTVLNEKKASVTFDESEKERPITSMVPRETQETQSDRKRRLSSRS